MDCGITNSKCSYFKAHLNKYTQVFRYILYIYIRIYVTSTILCCTQTVLDVLLLLNVLDWIAQQKHEKQISHGHLSNPSPFRGRPTCLMLDENRTWHSGFGITTPVGSAEANPPQFLEVGTFRNQSVPFHFLKDLSVGRCFLKFSPAKVGSKSPTGRCKKVISRSLMKCKDANTSSNMKHVCLNIGASRIYWYPECNRKSCRRGLRSGLPTTDLWGSPTLLWVIGHPLVPT